MNRSPIYFAGCLFNIGWMTLLAITALVLIKHFVFDILPIKGLSMYPNFYDKDIVVLNKISYVTALPQRGDDVVLRFPGDPDHQRYIKRLIGLPGEHLVIRDGKIFINNNQLFESYIDTSVSTYPATDITLKSDEYYLIGDNRDNSSDSRIWGTARRTDFIGKAFFILYPVNRFQAVPEPVY
jgi:signal peptidase I